MKPRSDLALERGFIFEKHKKKAGPKPEPALYIDFIWKENSFL